MEIIESKQFGASQEDRLFLRGMLEGKSIMADRAFVLEVVGKFGFALNAVSAELREDPEIVMTAINKDIYAGVPGEWNTYVYKNKN